MQDIGIKGFYLQEEGSREKVEQNWHMIPVADEQKHMKDDKRIHMAAVVSLVLRL